MPANLAMERTFPPLNRRHGGQLFLMNRDYYSDEHRIQSQLKSWLTDSEAICCARASAYLPIADEEWKVVVNAVPKRQAEFVAGRWCAHRALEAIGSPACCLPVANLGGPQWPPGIAGSITHESGICLAVVARKSRFDSMGVDLFDRRRDEDINEVSRLILGKAETGLCHAGLDSTLSLMLAFSAKESVVKAVSAQVGRFLDMREITLSIEAHSFRARITGFPHEVWGRWASVGSFFLTMAAVNTEAWQCSTSFGGTQWNRNENGTV